MKIVFATYNSDKLNEIRNALSTASLNQFEIFGLNEIGIDETIPETQDTIKGNAIQKAQFIYDRYSLDCFADDTGLEVIALNNRPGIYSARYAGENCSYEDNVNKLLLEMKDITNREARFYTSIALIIEGNIKVFDGFIRGIITQTKRGNNGFGYDPIFQPIGYTETFAEMSLEKKNKISHRAMALNKLIEYLSRLN